MSSGSDQSWSASSGPSVEYTTARFHVYNDDGGLGRFGELECNGQTIGGSTGRSSSTDQMLLWIYVGDMTAIKEIALHLLGVEI